MAPVEEGGTTKFESLRELVEYESLLDRRIDGTDSRDPHTSWLKFMFRKSWEWKSFCESLISKRGSACERCGGDGRDCSGLQVHHRDPWDYTNLKDETKFVVLCGRCHLVIEGRCATEEKMRTCPNVDKKFLTVRPYRDPMSGVISKQSGTRMMNKWERALRVRADPDRYTNPDAVPDVRREQVDEALKFMREHKELYR